MPNAQSESVLAKKLNTFLTLSTAEGTLGPFAR
jgi:hypothetical protein